jgi:hypothetical protein
MKGSSALYLKNGFSKKTFGKMSKAEPKKSTAKQALIC